MGSPTRSTTGGRFAASRSTTGGGFAALCVGVAETAGGAGAFCAVGGLGRIAAGSSGALGAADGWGSTWSGLLNHHLG